MTNTIYINFDMDGTIADFYNVPHWLEAIRAFDTTPYEVARPMFHRTWMTRQLNRLQACGYKLRIISWSSKDSTPEFDEAVRIAKVEWLARNLPAVHWDEIHVIPYGTPKHLVGAEPGGILFDDNETIRHDWGEGAFDEQELFTILKRLGL